MLVISYLIDKAADWIQSYINKKFHSEEEKNKIFSNYKKFVKKIIAIFESVNSKKEVKHKLEYLKQKESASNYITEFRQIISVFDWNNKAYVSLFYQELKDKIKDKLTKIKWLDDLDNMIRIAVQINNWLWKRQQKILEKINKNETRIRKKIMNSQWIESTLIIKKQTSSKMIVKRKNYVFIVKKVSIKSKNAEIYNKKNQQKHEHK